MPWKVHLIDTGLNTMTGGRIKRLSHVIGSETFLCTYGDGLASVDPAAVLAFHRREGRAATVTAVRPPARFGVLEIEGTRVEELRGETADERRLDQRGILRVSNRRSSIGSRAMKRFSNTSRSRRLAADGQLSVFKHDGFWQPVDTLRDKKVLDDLWAGGHAPWRRAAVHA